MGASLFCDPLAGLDPNDAANEHTVVWTGLTLGGTTTSTFGTSGGKYTTRYLGGLAAVPRVARAPLGSWINSLVVTVTKTNSATSMVLSAASTGSWAAPWAARSATTRPA